MTHDEGKPRPKNLRLKRALIALAVLAVFDWIYPVVWISLPMPGQVVDGVSHQPVADAIVVATWRLNAFDTQVGSAETQEVTTDHNGRFVVPGWGPYFRFRLGYISENQPQLWILAPNYSPTTYADLCCGVQKPHFLASIRLPVIEMKPASNDLQQRRKQLSEWSGNLAMTLQQSSCEWFRIPRTNDALKQAGRSFEAAGLGTVDLFATPPKCKGLLDP